MAESKDAIKAVVRCRGVDTNVDLKSGSKPYRHYGSVDLQVSRDEEFSVSIGSKINWCGCIEDATPIGVTIGWSEIQGTDVVGLNSVSVSSKLFFK